MSDEEKQQQQNPDQIVRAHRLDDNWSELDELSRVAEVPLITLFVSDRGMLQPVIQRPFYRVLESIGKVDDLGLFLRSTGGITEVPWKIVSLLREYGKELTVLLPEAAHSGATHIALAADRLVMTEFSTLSSVDPTRRHALLPQDSSGNPIPMSVQDLKHCMEFVESNLGSWSTPRNKALVLQELFRHIHPLAVGAIEQSADLSQLITRRVLATRQSKLSKKQTQRIVEKLAGKYFSHVFLLSRKDVREDLGLAVVDAKPELKEPMESLLDKYERLSQPIGQMQLAQGGSGMLSPTYFIESQSLRIIGYTIVDQSGNMMWIQWKSLERGAP